MTGEIIELSVHSWLINYYRYLGTWEDLGCLKLLTLTTFAQKNKTKTKNSLFVIYSVKFNYLINVLFYLCCIDHNSEIIYFV